MLITAQVIHNWFEIGNIQNKQRNQTKLDLFCFQRFGNRPGDRFSNKFGTGLTAPKARLVLKPNWFLKLSIFFFCNAKTQRGLFHRFLKQVVNLSCYIRCSFFLCKIFLKTSLCSFHFLSVFHSLFWYVTYLHVSGLFSQFCTTTY